MFQLIERDGQRMGVHSKSDLDYMIRRGWKPVAQQVAAILKPAQVAQVAQADDVQPRQKRKYVRKAK